MSIFQLITIIFALFMMYVVRVKNRKYKLGFLETAGWYVMWLLFVFVALFPNVLLGVVDTLHFSRVFDLLVVGAFMFVTTLLVFTYFKIKELDQKLERYTRDEATNVKK
ncbi:DUF2304 domain-containing protein [Candidatus Woesebacteria bacterium]|nr:DUF2304 domain-containing protein [Candidatus Woesebacteria bacterium]